jgi:asparagine synthase (glutamine-hydrolysing)
MNEVLAPRGPDGHGALVRGHVALGQRRLRIIDLSERGAQPMLDSESGVACVFNGCIYNHVELRQLLEARSHRFFSSSDTEVVLRAYLEWGEQFVTRLNGMFAFALHERDSGDVLLGRDRLGIKPLYYTRTDSRMRFASTLPALVAAGEVSSAIDPVALHHYMTFHSVVPPPLTILRDVRKLPPATLMRIDSKGSTRQHRYWTLRFGADEPDRGSSEEEYKERLLAALRGAVRRRLVADVPVGVLLSGGVDSSLIVGLLAEQGQTGLSTFSIGFDSAGGEDGNEFVYSDEIAERFGTDHHQLFIPTERMLPALEDCVRAMSEPMVSHDVIGFYLLSQEVARHIKVVQCGQGADELFAGYHWYPPMVDAADPVAGYAQAFFDREHAELSRVLERGEAMEDYSRQFVAEHFARVGADDPVDKALRLDATVMLVDDPVKRVDNMTMRWGLEARVPFLDHHVVELAAQIPASLKLPQGGKHILKEAAREVVPASVIDRPKGYFPVPMLKYLSGPTLDRVRDVLGQAAARTRGIFRRDYVETLLAAPSEHITPLRGSKLWQLALLEYWLQVHEI